MGVPSILAGMTLTPDCVARGWRQGIDVAHFLRSAQIKAGEAVRQLELIRSTVPADDPNKIALEAVSEALS
jgi:hypothetical protein